MCLRMTIESPASTSIVLDYTLAKLFFFLETVFHYFPLAVLELRKICLPLQCWDESISPGPSEMFEMFVFLGFFQDKIFSV